MRSIAVILATVLIGTSAYAADTSGHYFVVGAGSRSCKEYTGATDQQKLYAETWLAGYITALNRATPDTYHIVGETTPEAMNGMIAKYCADNPDIAVGIAIHKVVEYLQPKRIRKSPN
jgi:hypothetical protein